MLKIFIILFFKNTKFNFFKEFIKIEKRLETLEVENKKSKLF